MKKTYVPTSLAIALALLALFVSQFLWLKYASDKNSQEQDTLFQASFNKSLSILVNKIMNKGDITSTYKIEKRETITQEEKRKAVYAGDVVAKNDVTIMIENSLIYMSVRDSSFKLAKMNDILTDILNKKGHVVLTRIILKDITNNKILDEIQKDYTHINNSFKVNTYTAERKIKIPNYSFLIRAEYGIQQPGYIRNMGIITTFSFITSIIIISVFIYLFINLQHRYKELINMERSFHGAIHDLKSPLAFVYLALSSLEEKETDINKRNTLQLTGNRVHYLANKIMHLLKFGQDIKKIRKEPKEKVYIYDIFEQVETEITSMFHKKEIKFKNEIDTNLCLKITSDLFEAVIRILIENAVKYNTKSPIINISSREQDRDIIISIRDNGIGISKHKIKKLFKPYRTSDTKHGTGIGLYYAMRIIKAHKGKITVESVLEQGSIFTISLPKIYKI